MEVVSPSEGDGLTWDEKLGRYHQVGVSELVRFDPEAPEGQRLRVWDRVKGDLVERQIDADRTPCLALGLAAWTVPHDSGTQWRGRAPRPARRGRRGAAPPGTEEAEARKRAEAEAGRAAADAGRAEANAGRAAAEARVRELEEQLRRARGDGGGSSGAS